MHSRVEEKQTRRAVRHLSTLIAAGFMLAANGVAAQENSATMRGVVYDSATGLGLADVAIHVNQSLQPERTDSLGEFLLTGLAAGSYNLTLATEGYTPEVFWFSVTADGGDTVNIGGLPLGQLDGAITGAFSGTIIDSKTNLPVVGIGVSVNGDLATFSGDSGDFVTGIVNVDPGPNVVEFKRIGYEPLEFRLWAVRSHTDFDIEVTVNPLPVSMETVVVEADRTIFVFGALQEFYRRRRTRMGHFVTQQDVEEQHPILVSDMFRMMPGIQVRPGYWGGNRIETTGPRSLMTGCASLAIFIDGFYISTESSEELDWLVHPGEVAGIEVYPRPAQVPGRFKISQAVCGVIAVWTRRF